MAAGESAAEHAQRMRDKARRLDAAADKWKRGAEGERQVAGILSRLPPVYVVFHDLKLPGSQANVDHLVVGPSGVWAVDTKNYSYPVTFGSGKGAGTLWTGRQPMTRTLETSAWEASAVADLIGYPVDAMLCVIAPSLPKPAFDFGPTRICSPRTLLTELNPSSRPPVDVSVVVDAVQHAFGVKPAPRTPPPPPPNPTANRANGASAVKRKRVVRQRRQRRHSRGRLAPLVMPTLKLIAAILFLLFGVSLTGRILGSIGQEVGDRMAASVARTTVADAPSTTAPSAVTAGTAEPSSPVDPPPPVVYTVACSPGGASWDISWVWPGDPPSGVAGYGVRSQRDDGPALNHSIRVWTSAESRPTDITVSRDRADFIVITEYRDESGAVLAQTEDPFREPSLTC